MLFLETVTKNDFDCELICHECEARVVEGERVVVINLQTANIKKFPVPFYLARNLVHLSCMAVFLECEDILYASEDTWRPSAEGDEMVDAPVDSLLEFAK
jgi:hypothetical protein